ncbi:MAG: MerR family transcriptional regulator [SAR86 cluster bacterium]|uniref:MerR family transcriptional regulator n=1 Tax=SAR86 cluster bacterium TaxID=2030880 RepID=A0A2A4MHC3_9GAMM|nr:MAG: MerR family transcriptional regulator [SAR86 cluster bacterium]
MKNRYTISQLASEFKITPRSIRFYEEKGMLSPVREGSVRIYSGSEKTKLKLILRGKRLGFSLAQSGDIIKMYDPKSGNNKQMQTLLASIRDKQELLRHQRQEINTLLKDLKQAEDKCLEALSKS